MEPFDSNNTPVQQSDQQVPPHQYQNQQQQQIYDQIPRSTNPNAFTTSHMPQPQPSDFINPEASFNSSAASSFPGQGIQSSHVQSQVDQQSHQDQNLSNVNPPHQSADHPHASNSSTNQPKTQHEEHLSDFSDFSDNSGEHADENQQKQSVLRKRKRRESGDNLGPSNIHNQDEESKDYLNASSEQHHGHHHGHPDIEDDGIDLDNYDQSLKTAKFIMKNGCCRECMKAFSKTGKVCNLNLNYQHFTKVLLMLSSQTPEKSYSSSEWLQILRLQGMQSYRHSKRQATRNQEQIEKRREILQQEAKTPRL
eukprot:403355367